MEATGQLVLPKLGGVSLAAAAFLDDHFKTHEDLSNAPRLFAELNNQSSDLDLYLLQLQRNLAKRSVSWISSSFAAKNSLRNLHTQLESLSLYASPGFVLKRKQRNMVDELRQIADQLRQIGSIRKYIETTLQVETLIGDLEDAIFFTRNCHKGTSLVSEDFRNKKERYFHSIKVINDVEEVMVYIDKVQPRWQHLLLSVDSRFHRALGTFRQEILAEYRSILASLGWPPKLLTPKAETGDNSLLLNPLASMDSEKRKSFYQSFQVLCALQHVQVRRETRKFKTLGQTGQEMKLWAINELVSPVASRMEYHFLKWAEQPELIFALVYKITRDFVGVVSDILQPLIDRSRLLSYSAREALVSAMVNVLSEFLEKRVFPVLAKKYNNLGIRSEVSSSWLHLVDLIVAFDQQMLSLVRSEACLFLPDSERYVGFPASTSVLNILYEKPDWLKIWAKIELKDAWKKLKTMLKEERAWFIDNRNDTDLSSTESESFLLVSREDHKAPAIAESTVKIAWHMIDRCRTLPTMLGRVQFIRLAVSKFIWHYIKVLALHCQAVDFSSNYIDDDALVKACASINAAKYVESKLQEWSEDLIFLELKVAEQGDKLLEKDKVIETASFFNEEITALSELETNSLMDIASVLIRQFETLNWEHCMAAETISEAMEPALSSVFIEALDNLRRQLLVLKTNLNPTDFLDLWRSIAEGLDHFITSSISTSNIQGSSKKIEQFEEHIQALFLVFRPFCMRPEVFFPCVREILKLLELGKRGVDLWCKKDVKWLQFHGISHLSLDQVNNMLRTFKLGSCT